MRLSGDKLKEALQNLKIERNMKRRARIQRLKEGILDFGMKTKRIGRMAMKSSRQYNRKAIRSQELATSISKGLTKSFTSQQLKKKSTDWFDQGGLL